jgi:EpsI family protein
MQHYLVQVDHYVFGWALFAVALLPFFFLARRLESVQPQHGAAGDEDRRRPAAGEQCSVPVSRLVVVTGLLLLPLLAWSRAGPDATAPVTARLPAVAGWSGPTEPVARWSPKFSGPAGEERVSYRQDGQIIDVYVNWYRSQAPGRELVGYGNHIEGGTGWHVTRRAVHAPPAAAPGLDRLQETVLQSERAGQRLIWSWYVVGDTPLASPLQVKLLEAWRALTGRHGAGIVALSIDCVGPCDAVRPALAAAVRDLGAPLSGVYASPTPD